MGGQEGSPAKKPKEAVCILLFQFRVYSACVLGLKMTQVDFTYLQLWPTRDLSMRTRLKKNLLIHEAKHEDHKDVQPLSVLFTH
jgi:hypothetical protein